MNNFRIQDLFKQISISNTELEELAISTGFIQRHRSISGTDILFAFCSESTKGCVSYNDIASEIQSNGGVPVSKQPIWKKVTEPCMDFFKNS